MVELEEVVRVVDREISFQFRRFPLFVLSCCCLFFALLAVQYFLFVQISV